MTILKNILIGLATLRYEYIVCLPSFFSNIKKNYYNKRGCKIDSNVLISPNVRIVGKVEIGKGSSIAQNCSLTGLNSGIFIGTDVMIAPNVNILAFSHGYNAIDIPMSFQENIESPIYIEDDVWISANVTIAMGVRIGKGAIIGANSFVNKDVTPYDIFGGVPAKYIKSRT